MSFATAAAVAAAVVSAATAIYSGQQQKEAARANASMLEASAEESRKTAEYNAEMQRDKVKRLLSMQRAMHGRTGFDTSGTPLLVFEDTAAQGELDALVIRYGGDVQAAQRKMEANIQRTQGNVAATLGFAKAGATLLQSYGKYQTKTKSKFDLE